VPAAGGQLAVLGLLQASDPASDRAATLAALDALAANETLSPGYRDLAVLRRIALLGAELPAAERKAALDAVAVPGRPYRPIALELLALLQAETGDREGAIAALQALAQDQQASAGQRGRANQMVVALGGEPVAR
jgi:hypothetical protein